jgi:hypothetical protein
MIDIKKILKRSWHILWNYRTLWIFGFILALVTGGGSLGNHGSPSASTSKNNNQPGASQPQNSWQGLQGNTFAEKEQDALRQAGAAIQRLQAQYPVEFRMGIAVAITLLITILLLSLLGAFLRYVSETASIHMVDEYEQTGLKIGFRKGWQYGWSRTSWRLFLINLLVNIPVMVLLAVLVLIGWWIFSAAMSGAQWSLVTSLISGIGLAFLLIFITVILMQILLLVRDFAWRTAVLEGSGVRESLRRASGLVRRNWKSAGLMWLVMVGFRIAWGIAFFIVVIPLLIVSIVTAVGGVLVALVPTLLTAGIASLLAAPTYWPWIFALVIGAPFFFIVAFSPIILVSGWGVIYQSSVWTLTYREIKALETVAPALAG